MYVCMCVSRHECVCVCRYIYIHMCLYIYIYIYIQTHMYLHVCVCAHTDLMAAANQISQESRVQSMKYCRDCFVSRGFFNDTDT